MSISSESEPPYNDFYDKNEISDAESEGFIDRTVKKKAPAKARNVKSEASLFGGLFAPFEGCCFSRGPAGPPRHIGSARVTGPLSEFVLQTSELSEPEVGSDESSSEDEIALGATAKTYKQPKSTKNGADTNVDVSTLKRRLEDGNMHWKNLLSSADLDSTARWTVSLPLMEAIDIGFLELTNDQRKLAALYWCASSALSQKATSRLLEKIVSVAKLELPEEMTIEQAIKKRDEFGTLDYGQVIEARLIEEMMGEFEQLAAADDPSKAFLVISKVRTVATVTRRQGDALLISVFDCGITKERGPAILGFGSTETAETFLINLYTADPMVTKSSAKFSAWTILNKQQAGGARPEDLRAKGVILAGEEIKPIWDSEQVDHDLDDPQHNAKVAYTAMYKATDAPADRENIFTHSAAGAVTVKEKRRK